MSTSILIADDHDLFRMGLRHMLADNSDFEVIAEANSGEDAIDAVREHRPMVVLMDVKMPGMGGLEATKKILCINPETKVIAVTGLSDQLYADRVMKVGASGYVTKEAGFDEIVACIHTVMAGGRYMSKEAAQQMALKTFDSDSDKSPFEELSERELQTAIFISSGIKVNDIAESFCIAPRTVNTYRYRIHEKLGVTSDVEVALLAFKHNLLEL